MISVRKDMVQDVWSAITRKFKMARSKKLHLITSHRQIGQSQSSNLLLTGLRTVSLSRIQFSIHSSWTLEFQNICQAIKTNFTYLLCRRGRNYESLQHTVPISENLNTNYHTFKLPENHWLFLNSVTSTYEKGSYLVVSMQKAKKTKHICPIQPG